VSLLFDEAQPAECAQIRGNSPPAQAAWNRQESRLMPTTASHDTIDDAAFEAQLSNFDGSVQMAAGDSRRLPERLDPLDVAFPFAGADTLSQAPGSARNPPAFHPMHADAAARQSSARHESRHTSDRIARRNGASTFAIAVVIAIGLAAGATAATFMFYDRAAQIVAAWTTP
jgi:hypothetical protein